VENARPTERSEVDAIFNGGYNLPGFEPGLSVQAHDPVLRKNG